MVSFRKALTLNSKLFVPNLFLGIDLTEAGSPKEAIPYLLVAETLSPAVSGAACTRQPTVHPSEHWMPAMRTPALSPLIPAIPMPGLGWG